MHFVTSVAIAILIGVSQSINVLPTTVTCSNISTDCEVACGTGYKPCGSNECYNPRIGELCCGSNTPCPSGTFCSTEGKGCAVPTSPPPGENCTTASGYSGYGPWSVSGTSSAITSLSTLANTTITSASAPGNLSITTAPTATGSSLNNATYAMSSSASIASGITAVSTPVSNITYSTSSPITTTSVVAPAKTGAGSVLKVAIGAGVAAGWAQIMASWL